MRNKTEASLSIVGDAVSPRPTVAESSIFLCYLTLAISLVFSKVTYISFSVLVSECALAMHLSVQPLAFKVPLVGTEGPHETTFFAVNPVTFRATAEAGVNEDTVAVQAPSRPMDLGLIESTITRPEGAPLEICPIIALVCSTLKRCKREAQCQVSLEQLKLLICQVILLRLDH